MALVDQSKTIAAQLGEDEATIFKIIQQADEFHIDDETAAAAADADDLGRVRTLRGCFENRTKETLRSKDSHTYAGYVTIRFPDEIAAAAGGSFGATSHGSGFKAGVVYSGKNDAGDAFGWLIAFANTFVTGKKIYGECGPLENFKKIDWAQVENNLYESGTTVVLPNLKASIESFQSRTIVTAIIIG
uniref:Uncharacterized protein n=1 Tax=Oryza punctata TaxID=4537 RepID=A0A0E0LUS3_ORYPU